MKKFIVISVLSLLLSCFTMIFVIVIYMGVNKGKLVSDFPISPAVGELNGHKWVDLGLSVKWATCNVGAGSPSDFGDYYAWGELETKDEYTRENSVFYDKEVMPDCPHNEQWRWLYYYDDTITGDPHCDVARAEWGSTWRLPTQGEMWELTMECEWVWSSRGEINGYKVTGPNGNSIFLPATGWRGYKKFDRNEEGCYWTGGTRSNRGDDAWGLRFDSKYYYIHVAMDREDGLSVRPVTE